MTLPEILDLAPYSEDYGLKTKIIGVRKAKPNIDLDAEGLIMHGSQADPYTIFKFGLVPQQSKDNPLDTEWQVCLGLNSKSKDITLQRDMARKNSAVKYSGKLSPHGVIYILSPDVKKTGGYTEFWDTGEEGRGYAWAKRPILPDMITAVVTTNLPRVAAAMLASGIIRPIYKLDGTAYKIEEL